MSAKIFDRIGELSTTTGTGDVTVSGAIDASYKTFSSRLSVGDVFPGFIQGLDGSGNPNGEWETGVYTYSFANTITRTTVSESSNADALVSFSSGSKKVFISNIARAFFELNAGLGSNTACGDTDQVAYFDQSVNCTAPSTITYPINRMEAYPIIFPTSGKVYPGYSVTTGAANVITGLYDTDSQGRPGKLLDWQDLNISGSPGLSSKFNSSTQGSQFFTVKAGKLYWVTVLIQAALTFRSITSAGCRPVNLGATLASTTYATCYRNGSVSYANPMTMPDPFPLATATLVNTAIPSIRFTT